MIGIYLLKKDNVVVYVGQSIHIQRRIHNHRRDGKDFDSYEAIKCSKDNLNSTEAYFILLYNPVINKIRYDICVNVKRTSEDFGGNFRRKPDKVQPVDIFLTPALIKKVKRVAKKDYEGNFSLTLRVMIDKFKESEDV